MNKAGMGDLLMSNVIYLILLVVFLAGMLVFLWQYYQGAAVWEDYYAKEIVKVIDFSKAGDEIWLDVHKATEVAKKNRVKSFSEIFEINNPENQVCVKLSKGRKTCYSYFNEVDIISPELKLAEGRDKNENPVNLFYFKVIDVPKEVSS